MTVGKGKRPRDPNEFAKWLVDRSTGEAQEPETPTSEPTTKPADIRAYLASIGRKGGQIGGKRRLKTMTKEQRSRVASKAARARWKKSRP